MAFMMFALSTFHFIVDYIGPRPYIVLVLPLVFAEYMLTRRSLIFLTTEYTVGTGDHDAGLARRHLKAAFWIGGICRVSCNFISCYRNEHFPQGLLPCSALRASFESAREEIAETWLRIISFLARSIVGDRW